jgi:RhtB (resistance to homoserine/threonine) family protein
MIEAAAVISITLLAVLSPGADFAMVTRNSMLVSRRVGLFTAIGIALGVLVHVSYSMLGIGLLISQSIVLFNFIKLAGAVYLIYLGIRMLRAKRNTPQSATSAPVRLSAAAALRVGFLTNALNPKTTLFVVALFTQVIQPETPVLIQLAYGAFMSVAHLVWFILVAYAFSSEAARTLVGASQHLIERAIGAVLVTLGIGLALSSSTRS